MSDADGGLEPPAGVPDEAPASVPQGEPERCPACLGAVEPAQEYCLACGERLVPRGRRRRGPLPLPALLVAAALVLAGAGVVIAWALRSGDDAAAATSRKVTRVRTTTLASVPVAPLGSTTGPITTFTAPTGTTSGDTSPALPTGSGDTFPTNPQFPSDTTSGPTSSSGPDSTTTPSTPTSTAGCSDTSHDQADDDWPQDRSSAWAAVLISKSQDVCHRAWFEAQQQKAQGQGLTQLGILDSGFYASLREGYWVLYQGPLASRQAAIAAALHLRSLGWTNAYPRLVSQ